MSEENRPNVIVAFSDQHRAHDIGCAGNSEIHTPAMDRIATEGTRATNAYSTHPICGPSRACLISGQYPTSHGVITNEFALPTDGPSIAEAFHDAGYRTGYIGKWHLDGVPREKWTPPGPRRQGFDDFWAVHNCVHDYFNPQYYRDSPELIEEEGYEPTVQTNLALEFIQQNDDRPFCLFLSWGPPHDPYRLVPDEFRDRYEADQLSPRPNVEPILPGNRLNPNTGNVNAPPVREWGPRVSPDTYEAGEPYGYEDPREAYADYYASITAIDHELGRLLDALDAKGLAEETILTYTSDHGDLLYSHGNNQKGTPHEEAAGIPFIVRWPDEIPAGATTDTLLGITDVAPTLLGLSGVDIPDSMDGRDLASQVQDPTAPGPDYLVLYGENWRGIVTERYTYACVPTEIPELSEVPNGHALLFDRTEDPYQQENVVYDPSYSDVRADLRETLDERLEARDDPHLTLENMVEHLGRETAWERRQQYIDGELQE